MTVEPTYTEETLMGPVEYYVDAYKRPPFFSSPSEKAAINEANGKIKKRYLVDFTRIYRKRRATTNAPPAPFSEIKKNFDEKIKMERSRRRAQPKEVRKEEKEERRAKEIKTREAGTRIGTAETHQEPKKQIVLMKTCCGDTNRVLVWIRLKKKELRSC